MLSHVDAIEVSLWGRHVGTIVPKSHTCYRFAYAPEFLASGIAIAPFELPLEKREFSFPERPYGAFGGLPAVFADAIPDSFGNAVIDAWMEQRGIPCTSVTSLDRLAYVGSRAMGALEFAPQRGPRHDVKLAMAMRRIVEESRLVLGSRLDRMSGHDALKAIFRVGSSAGGAQAKAIVGWNPKSDRFCLPTDPLPEGFEHWIVKITPQERPYLGKAEFRTYEQARACGIDIGESRLYELDGVSHFMTRRFDRENGRRHHLLTFRAMRMLPPDVSLEMNSYGQLFETIVALGLGYGALEEMFRRMAFNVYVDESDDHSKNFSFLLKEGSAWQLAPAYDLTGGVPSDAKSDDMRRTWTNCHAMSINGKQSNITDDDLLAVASRYAIGTAPAILAEIKRSLENATAGQ